MNTTTAANVSFPAGSSSVDDWADVDTADPTRYFASPQLIVPCRHGDVKVYAAGLQHANGRVDPQVVVSELHSDLPITAEQARQIARALSDAVERWSAKE